MSTPPPPIFDTALQRRRLARARAGAPADFLLVRTADDIVERLETVRRRFGVIADVGTPGPHLTRALAERWPQARLLHLGSAGGAPLAAGRGTDPDRAPRGKSEARQGSYILADPERLPLAAESLDLAVSALALQGVNDLPGALLQIRRALKPDGLFLGALAGGRTLHELRAVLTEAETEISGGVSPRVAPFADVRDMGGLLQRGGFALPVADSDIVTVRYADLFALMADLRAMGATSALAARPRRFSRRDLFLRAAALYRERFADRDGRLRATFEIVSVSGWAPHASQQKPARRGSGTVSLAAALGDAAVASKD